MKYNPDKFYPIKINRRDKEFILRIKQLDRKHGTIDNDGEWTENVNNINEVTRELITMKIENYIPFNKEFLLEKQLTAFSDNPKIGADFKKLFDIIEHYYHYESFNLNRSLKQNYDLFDPDLSENEKEGFVDKSNFLVFKEILLQVLDRGNYMRVNQETLDTALNNSDLIGLNLAIDFNASGFSFVGKFSNNNRHRKKKEG